MRRQFISPIIIPLTILSLTACGKAAAAKTAETTISAAETSIETAATATATAEAVTGTLQDADGQNSSKAADTILNMQNPWTDSDKYGVLEETSFELTAPDGASDISYSFMKSNKIAQLCFKLDNIDWTYRLQPMEQPTDISGIYYDGAETKTASVSGREAMIINIADAKDASGKTAVIKCINWFDPVTGVGYSLSAVGAEAADIDIQSYAEAIYKPL